jgi:hypothetical protein
MPLFNGKRVLSTSVRGQWNVYYLIWFVDAEGRYSRTTLGGLCTLCCKLTADGCIGVALNVEPSVRS